jgi:hypothetical protein
MLDETAVIDGRHAAATALYAVPSTCLRTHHVDDDFDGRDQCFCIVADGAATT